MDYIKNLIVHSRGVYNFIGMILVAHVSFICSLLCIVPVRQEKLFFVMVNALLLMLPQSCGIIFPTL